MRPLAITVLLSWTLPGQPTASVVSSATFEVGGAVAPGMLATLFSPAIAGEPRPSISVADRDAVVLAASAGQATFVVPEGVAEGSARVVLNGELAATVRIAMVAPGMFTANGDGRGAPVGVLVEVAADGARTSELSVRDSQGRHMPTPFDAAKAGSQHFLRLVGTGLRNHAGAASATLGSTPVAVAEFGPDADPGLDYVRVGPVPASVAGKLGELELVVSFGSVPTNPVLVAPTLPAPGAWGSRARLPLANSEMAVAEAGGRIHVLGGYPADRVTTPAVQAYDPATDTWSIVAPMPAPVNHTMPAVVDGKIYIIGGQSDSGNSSFVNTVFEYDPAANTWRTRAPMPTARGGGAAAVLDGKIYVAGSRPPRGADFAVYDPRANTWTTLPNMPTQRNHLAAVPFEGKVYVIGGRFEAGFTSPVTDTVEFYDPVTNRWSRGARMPRSRGGLNAVEANGCIHVFGGEGNPSGPNGLFPDHDVYDPVSDTWLSLDAMPIPIHGVTGLAFLNGLIYLPGGGTSQGGSSGGTQHQVYRPQLRCR